MKSLRKILLSLAIASSLGAVSTTAVAYEEGRTVMTPAAAIDATVEKIRAAIAVIDNGAEGDAVADAVKEAIDMNKEINANHVVDRNRSLTVSINDVVDRNRQRAAGHLKKARTAAKNGQLQPAEEHLRQALKGFEALKGML